MKKTTISILFLAVLALSACKKNEQRTLQNVTYFVECDSCHLTFTNQHAQTLALYNDRAVADGVWTKTVQNVLPGNSVSFRAKNALPDTGAVQIRTEIRLNGEVWKAATESGSGTDLDVILEGITP